MAKVVSIDTNIRIIVQSCNP